MIQVEVRRPNEVKRLAKRLRRVRRKALPFALRAAMLDLAKLLKKADVARWRLDSGGRRRSFPAAVLRVNRPFVDSRLRVKRPAAVVSIGGDDVLRRAIRGGTLRAKDGGRLFVPARARSRRRARVGQQRRVYEADGYLFRRRGKGKRSSAYVGVLVDEARYPARWRIRRAEARVQRAAPAVVARHLRREIVRALDRR